MKRLKVIEVFKNLPCVRDNNISDDVLREISVQFKWYSLNITKCVLDLMLGNVLWILVSERNSLLDENWIECSSNTLSDLKINLSILCNLLGMYRSIGLLDLLYHHVINKIFVIDDFSSGSSNIFRMYIMICMLQAFYVIMCAQMFWYRKNSRWLCDW